MKLSKSAMTFKKLSLEENDKNMFLAQEGLIQAGHIMQFASGIFGFGNIETKLMENISNVIRKQFDKINLVEVTLPTLQPISIWEKSGRYENYVNDGTMLTTKTSHGDFALAPTAEEAIVEYVANSVKSYKALPFTLYQIREKFRNEIRNRGYMFRGKAFPMMDAYSFNEDFEGLQKIYGIIREAYLKIFEKLELKVLPVAADSGAIGGKKSEEFMLISPLGEDTILYNEKLNLGLNVEILEKENYEDYLKEEYGIDSLDGFEKVKAVELGHIFQLGTIYSESMNAKFAASDETLKPFVMGCYGIGISRTAAVLLEERKILKDNKFAGISLPLSVTPYVASIVYSDHKEEQANEMYEELRKSDIPVLLDDRNLSFGQKLNDTGLWAVPYRVLIGNKVDNGYCQVENTWTGKSQIMSIPSAIEALGVAFSTKQEINLD